MLNQIYLRQTYLMICAQRAFSSRKMCSLWIIFVAGMQQRNHPAKSSVRYQAQHSCCFALSRWFSLPSLQTLQPSTMKMLETCVGHAFSTWKLGNFCGGFYKRKSVSWSSWFLQGMGQWQWPVLPTHCNIYIYISVCVFLLQRVWFFLSNTEKGFCKIDMPPIRSTGMAAAWFFFWANFCRHIRH